MPQKKTGRKKKKVGVQKLILTLSFRERPSRSVVRLVAFTLIFYSALKVKEKEQRDGRGVEIFVSKDKRYS